MTLLPDVESLVVQFLKADSDVDAIVDGRVSGDLPKQPTFPALRVTLIDDQPAIDQWVSGARVQVDAFGTTREEARTLARTAFASLTAWYGASDDAVISLVRSLQGVRRLPEPADNRARYGFDVRVIAHPAPAS